jgi:hypothetical protein
MRFRVTHIEGSKKGAVENYEVPALTVGRDPSNILAFDPIKDDRVSTRHATIGEQGGNVVVTDLNARNGTLVNGVRIQGSVPIKPGALVQFGEGGPMVQLQFELAAAPAPTPAPAAPAAEPKKGGKGCVILLVLAMIGVPCLGGAGYLGYRYWFGTSSTTPTLPTIPTDPKAIGREIGKQIENAGDKPPTGEKTPATGATVESPWKKVGIGTVFEFESQMKMPSMEMKTKMVWTLVERNDEVAKLKMETVIPNMDPQVTTTDMPLKAKGGDETTKPTEEKSESVTVPAGTFDCRYVKMVTKTGDVETTSESWTPKDLPVPCKTVTKSGETVTTMVMTRLEKK